MSDNNTDDNEQDDKGTVLIFAYGSLIWSQPDDVKAMERGSLNGYSRSFCIYSHVYRGTPEKPGLVLGLHGGGACDGLVMEISKASYQKVFDREMVTQVYVPKTVLVNLESGEQKPVETFITDPHHTQYAGELTIQEQAEYIVGAKGKGGKNTDYLNNTVKALQEHGIEDKELLALQKAVEDF